MIALVSPAAIAIGRKAALRTWRSGQTEGDVGRAEAHVDPELVADQADRGQRDRDRIGGGADGHGQRVDDHVLGGDPVVVGRRDDLARALQALLRRLGDAGLVVGQADDGGAVLGHQRQDLVQALVLGGDRVDQGAALVDRQARLEGLDHRGVDADRQVDGVLDGGEHRLEQLGLVDQRDAGVDVEHVGAGLGLGQRVGGHGGEVAVAQFLGEDLAPGGVDALADDAEGLLGADRDATRARPKHCIHWTLFRFVGGFRGGRRASRCPRPCGRR